MKEIIFCVKDGGVCLLNVNSFDNMTEVERSSLLSKNDEVRLFKEGKWSILCKSNSTSWYWKDRKWDYHTLDFITIGNKSYRKI